MHHPDTKTTTYGIELDHCPLDNPEPWLDELLFYLPYGDALDLQNSATDFVLDYQTAKEALELATGR